MTKGTRIIGYTRVSTDDQGENGGGMTAQRDAIQAEAERRGWNIVHVYSEVASAKDMKARRRPELAAAIAAIEAGEADALVVAKLDRLSRSLLDFASIMERAQQKRWEIVVLDQQFDMTTSSGRAMAGMLAVFAQWERDVIRERTRAALAAKQRRGERVGRPEAHLIPPAIRHRIVELREQGMSRNGIANLLNRQGIPTAAGGQRWYASTIKRVLDSAGVE